VGYKLSASQAAMERPIQSLQQDLASALATARAFLRRDDPLDPGHELQPAIRKNPPLLPVAEGLLWKLSAKMRKWSAIVCGFYNMFSCVTTGNIHDPTEGCLRGAIHDLSEGHNTGDIHDPAEGHPCAHS